MSRRLMLRNESAGDTIPIGVNFYDATQSINGKYIDQTTALPISYLPTKKSSLYKITNKMPYDSAYTFSASGITVAGSTTGIGIDENGYYRVFIEATTGSTIKSIITAYEQDSGIKIVAVRFTCTSGAIPVWERIS